MSTVASSIAINSHGGSRALKEGNKTSAVYSLLRDCKFADAVKILQAEVQNHPKNRAALSLLGYAHYFRQDFAAAAPIYESLTKYHGEVQEYRMLYAQTLYKAAEYEAAAKACVAVTDEQYKGRVTQLLAAIKYEQDDLVGAKQILDTCSPDDAEVTVALAAIMYKEADFEGARLKFQSAMGSIGYQPDIAYNMALCHYKMKQFAPALKYIGEIIERGVREHPELSVGSNTDGVEVRSVGNSQTLKDTALIEAFNLKADIEYQLKNFNEARIALSDMPPRSEEELDPVTLHNQALMQMETEPTDGFRKLNFLLSIPPFPPETFGNLLLLYCKYQYYDLAADVLAEHAHLHATSLSPELLEFLEASIMMQSSPEESYRKFDILAHKHIDVLRKLTKHIQDARMARDNEQIKAALKEYDEALERYIPVLMAQAKIYWDIENYPMVEKIFKQSSEFCSEHDVWKLNLAHVLFMQETKYRDAIANYEPSVNKHADSLLDVTAIVLANLCVSYIMTSQNTQAEELMRHIEKEEERLTYHDPDKHSYHLCIVNLVIGTLYCAKNNYEFGISRIMKSLEPYDKKLGADTWYYAKRCFLGLIENIAKHMFILKDDFYHEIMAFFDAAEEHGKERLTVLNQQGQQVNPKIHNVSYEARLFKKMFYQLRD